MPTLKGLDSSGELTKHAIALKAQAYDFVIRYYSFNSAKNLSLGEARALSDAGLQIGVVWETSGTKASFFNRSQGVTDGSTAYHMAQNKIGQPSESAIYFAVDYDASTADLAGLISDYFNGVKAGFKAASNGDIQYKIGVYGSGLCCEKLLQANLVELTWLSQSSGFADSKTFAKNLTYNLIQQLPQEITLDDGIVLSIDPDSSNGNLPTGLFQV